MTYIGVRNASTIKRRCKLINNTKIITALLNYWRTTINGLNRRFRRISHWWANIQIRNVQVRPQVLQWNGDIKWRRGSRAGTGGGMWSTIHGGSIIALLLMGVHADLRCTGATTGWVSECVYCCLTAHQHNTGYEHLYSPKMVVQYVHYNTRTNDLTKKHWHLQTETS